MAGEVAKFSRESLQDPVRVDIARSGATAERAEQHVFLVGEEEKTALLLALLELDRLSTLVFTRTKRRADRLSRALARAGHKVSVIHGDRSQSQRDNALDGFRAGTSRVLVATDIAARGIDVAEIGHVVNFDLPHVPEDYVHRVGRTARAEASGRASSFASPDEQDLLRGIEKLTRRTVARAAVPREHEHFQREVRVLLNQQNGDAQRLIDLDDLFENRFCKNRRDPEGWFVQHQTTRLAHERTADRQHLLLTSGQCTCDLARSFFQSREDFKNKIEFRAEFVSIFAKVGAH